MKKYRVQVEQQISTKAYSLKEVKKVKKDLSKMLKGCELTIVEVEQNEKR